MSYIKDVYSKIRSKTTCFGLIWPSLGFSFSLKVSLYKLRCGDLPSDYNSSMPMYRLVLYYINIYIYIYSLSVGGGGEFHPGGVSWMMAI